MREQGDEGGVPMYSEDDRLLPWYLGERSRALRQRSAMCDIHCLSHSFTPVNLVSCLTVPPQRGEGHVHWLYVGETLWRSAGPRVQ